MRKPMTAAEIKAKADRACGIAAPTPYICPRTGRVWTAAEDEAFWRDFDADMDLSFRRIEAEDRAARERLMSMPSAGSA